MKTAIIYGPRDIRVEEAETPIVGPDDVLVQVRVCGICGSDVHRYLGTDYGRYSTYPMNSGHEYCGDVVEVGSAVEKFRAGDKVTLGISWGGGKLGAFSEFVHIADADQGLCRVPDGISYINGALIETLIVAINSYHRPDPKPDEHILILGSGTIGLCVLLLCRARGLQNIIVSEPSAKRRALAAQYGIKTVDPATEDLAEIVMETTRGEGIAVTFDCAGEEAATNQAFALTRRGGRISLISHYRTAPQINVETLIMKSMNVFGPDYGHALYDEAVALILEGKVDLTPLVSHAYPLERAGEAFETAANVNESVKALLNP